MSFEKLNETSISNIHDRSCVIIVNANKKESAMIKNIGRLVGIRDCFMENGIVVWDYYAHNDFVKKIGLLVGADAVQYKDECHKIISRDFPMAKK